MNLCADISRRALLGAVASNAQRRLAPAPHARPCNRRVRTELPFRPSDAPEVDGNELQRLADDKARKPVVVTTDAQPVGLHDEATRDNTPILDTTLEMANETFNWTARWWPVLPIECLEPKIPQHVDLLSMSLVVWCDSQGHWHCLEDRCPHRLAPLSEGRVEGDTLMCSYHGWCFDGQGACTRIPQLEFDPKAHQSACASKRARPARFPTRVDKGLLWVWPESGPEATVRAAANSELPVYSFDDDGGDTWYMRDLAQRYDTTVENFLDPSHLPFAHHGVSPFLNRYKENSWIAAWNKMASSPVQLTGFTVTSTDALGSNREVEYRAPFLVRYGDDTQLVITPTKPGWTRIFFRVRPSRTFWDKMSGLQRSFYIFQKNLTIPWYHISNRAPLLDTDTYMLHLAERALPPSGGLGIDTAARAYYMPAGADTGVLSWRKWLSDFAGPVPTCRPQDEAKMPTSLSKEQALNRWESHSKHCPHCKNAVAWIDRLLPVTRVVGWVALTSAVAQLAMPLACTVAGPGAAVAGAALSATTWVPALVGLVLAVACAAGHRALQSLRQQFFYVDFCHALND